MSINSLSQSFIPYNINGLTEVNSDTSVVNTLQINSLTPNKAVVSDSNNFLVSASASTTEVNYLLGTTSNIQTQINSKATTSYVDTNFLNKTTISDQTVSGTVNFQKELNLIDNRKSSLSSKVIVDANYQSLITSANVSVGQYFGTITNVGSIYQSTCTNNTTPILILFPIVEGKRYNLQIETLIEDASYDWTIDIYQSQDDITPYPNFNDAILDSYIFAPSSTLYYPTNASFIATTTGSIVLTVLTTNPSGIGTVKWKDMTVYEMGVSLNNISLQSLNQNTVAVINDKKQLVSSGISTTKLDYLDNVSSDIQTQLNGKVSKIGDTMTGTLDMGINKITTTYVPINGEDLINKTYADTTFATTSALANYLPITGGTLTGNFTVESTSTTFLSGGLTVGPAIVGMDSDLVGYTGSSLASITVSAVGSPPPNYQANYTGSLNGGLQITGFTPIDGRVYTYTFTKIYRLGLPNGLLGLTWYQGTTSTPLDSPQFVSPTSYANAITITGTFTANSTSIIFLGVQSSNAVSTTFYFDSFLLTYAEAIVSAALSCEDAVLCNSTLDVYGTTTLSGATLAGSATISGVLNATKWATGGDYRTGIAPNLQQGGTMGYYFGTQNNNNTGGFSDMLLLNGWVDGSAGSVNLLALNKGGKGIRQFQGTSGSASNFSTWYDCVMTDANSPDITTVGKLVVGGTVVISNNVNSYVPGCIYTDTNWGMLFRGAVVPNVAHMRWDKSDGTQLMRIQNTNVLSFTGGGESPALPNTTRTGAVIIGNIGVNYGGGWQAGLLMECLDTTEISCHDSGARLTSFIYYNGANRLYLGRDIGWGATPVDFAANVTIKGAPNSGSLNVMNPNGTASHLGWVDNCNYIRGVITYVDTTLTLNNVPAPSGYVGGGQTNNYVLMRNPTNGQMVMGALSIWEYRNNSANWRFGFSIGNAFYINNPTSSVMFNIMMSGYGNTGALMTSYIDLRRAGTTYATYTLQKFINTAYNHEQFTHFATFNAGLYGAGWWEIVVYGSSNINTDSNDQIYMNALVIN